VLKVVAVTGDGAAATHSGTVCDGRYILRLIFHTSLYPEAATVSVQCPPIESVEILENLPQGAAVSAALPGSDFVCVELVSANPH
jgi:hypothetical protein